MPRVIRVGDKDNDPSHPGDPGPNVMIENDSEVWIEEGASAAAAVAVEMDGAAFPEADAADILDGIRSERAAGGDPTRTEPGERAGDSDGSSAPLGTIQEPPAGASGATGDWNTYPPIPNDNLLEFRGRTWSNGANESQIDPGAAELARRIARATGRKLSIISAYRDRTKNKSVDGATNSNHMRGTALDIPWGTSTTEGKERVLRAAIEAGAQGIGIYDIFIHVDIDTKRAWGPNGSRCSLPRYPWALSLLVQSGHVTLESNSRITGC
jgi:hypothetical protein